MNIQLLSILIALVGCFVGLAGWLSGRDKKISNDSEWKGSVNAKLDNILGISADLKSVKAQVDENSKTICALERDIKSAHNRIDELAVAFR